MTLNYLLIPGMCFFFPMVVPLFKALPMLATSVHVEQVSSKGWILLLHVLPVTKMPEEGEECDEDVAEGWDYIDINK